MTIWPNCRESTWPKLQEANSLVWISTCNFLKKLLFKAQLIISGSGAFGEVFEGIVTGARSSSSGDNSSSNVSKVAIKTLKKRESSIEFLKEALAASRLKHENIVEFLGVCLESNLIILELMEGGELLTYLKSMRRYLTLWDLVDISHDVAKGCAYLERMKFVHRDLAARNCLLTSTNPQTRKVGVMCFSNSWIESA